MNIYERGDIHERESKQASEREREREKKMFFIFYEINI